MAPRSRRARIRVFDHGQQLVEAAGSRAGQHDLRAVDHAAAAKGNHAIDLGMVAPQPFVQRRQPLDVGIGEHFGFDRREPVAEQVANAIDQPERDGLGKRDEDRAALAQELGQSRERAAAGVHVDGVVEGPHGSLGESARLGHCVAAVS